VLLDTSALPDRYERWHQKACENRLEVELSVRVISAFDALPDWRERTIGLIAPYRLQARQLESACRRQPRLAEALRSGRLQVGTVDSFQGQQKDLIVVSCTRSNKKGILGFVDRLQRVNVALSRACRRLVVIADGSTIRQARLQTSVAGDPQSAREPRKVLAALLDHTEAAGGCIAVPADWRERYQ
jgi:hypothetical protein